MIEGRVSPVVPPFFIELLCTFVSFNARNTFELRKRVHLSVTSSYTTRRLASVTRFANYFFLFPVRISKLYYGICPLSISHFLAIITFLIQYLIEYMGENYTLHFAI